MILTDYAEIPALNSDFKGPILLPYEDMIDGNATCRPPGNCIDINLASLIYTS